MYVYKIFIGTNIQKISETKFNFIHNLSTQIDFWDELTKLEHILLIHSAHLYWCQYNEAEAAT